MRERERIAAVVAPATVFLVGAVTPRSRAARIATNAAIAGSFCGALAVALASRRIAPRQGRQSGGNAPVANLHVLVPARDEAAVIADLIDDLGRQEVRDRSAAPGFALTVIDDRSTDGTGDIATAAFAASGLQDVATCLRRNAGPDGKGAALASVTLDHLADEAIVVVLDADARLAPDVLAALAHAIADDAPAITARRRVLAPADGRRAWLARWQDDEQTVDGAIQHGRLALGGTGELRGNGMAVRAGLLRSIGGWDPAALTEDLEATTRLVSATGTGVRWSPEVEVWEQPVLDVRGLLRQRVRWAEGAVRRDLRITWPAVFTGPLPDRLRLDLAAYAAQMLVPWLALGLLARSNRPAARKRLVALGSVYAVGGAVMATTALGRLDRRFVGVIAMGAIWPVVVPIAWIRVALSRGPLHFAKTTHGSGFSRPTPHGDPAAVALPPPQASDRSRATTRPDGAGAARW